MVWNRGKEDIRERYKKWSEKFRRRQSDTTLSLRPQTYRQVFKEEELEEDEK